MTFDEFLNSELTGLRKYATVLTGDPHRAQDVLADALLRAHTGWSRIAVMDFPAAYVRRMVTSQFLSEKRRWSVRMIRSTRTGELPDVHLPDPAIAADDRAQLADLLAGLAPRPRVAIVLRYYLGLETEEVAAEMGITAGAGGLMNTISDLHADLSALATRAPSDAEVRGALADRIHAHTRRRRTTSLIAAAAAVVLLAGGAGIAGALLSHRAAGPATPTPVVIVPAVPLPANTKLVRHQLQPVTTPVKVVPPKGLSGNTWMSAPGRLSVSFFDSSALGDAIVASDSSVPVSRDGGGSTSPTAGYTITEQRDEKLQSFGPNGPITVKVTHQNLTVGGHSATLDTAPTDTIDEFGFPAAERISWQLPAGSWIHVWASGLANKGALRDFAASITDEPQTLDRTVGIGLSLAGLTIDSSLNSWPAVAGVGASVYQCPRGVDPMTVSYSSSSESGSSSSNGSSSTETTTNRGPASRCLTAAVMNIPVSQLQGQSTTDTITIGDTVAHIDTKTQSSWADLGDGATAIVGAPRDVPLSAADLAALVASVRLSPAATLIPMQISEGSAQLGAATVMGSASAIPAPIRTQPAEDPVTATAQRKIVTGYLDAVKARDCTSADRYFVRGKPQIGNGDLCHVGSLRLLGYRIDGAPATPSPDDAVFAVTITTTGGDETMRGLTTWFLDLHRQASGDWLITGGGSGP